MLKLSNKITFEDLKNYGFKYDSDFDCYYLDDFSSLRVSRDGFINTEDYLDIIFKLFKLGIIELDEEPFDLSKIDLATEEDN